MRGAVFITVYRSCGLSVRRCAMCQRTPGIDETAAAQPPRLHCRRAGCGHAELVFQIESAYVLPPGIQVIDDKLHHKIISLFKGRQNEAADTNPKDNNIAIKNFFEA